MSEYIKYSRMCPPDGLFSHHEGLLTAHVVAVGLVLMQQSCRYAPVPVRLRALLVMSHAPVTMSGNEDYYAFITIILLEELHNNKDGNSASQSDVQIDRTCIHRYTDRLNIRTSITITYLLHSLQIL